MRGEIEHRWRDVGSFIREQRHQGKVSLRKLSERAGISNPYLSQIERGLRQPSTEILQRIARALEISSDSLYLRAGILDESSERLDASVAIRVDPHLSEPQRAELLALYRRFRAETEAATPSAPPPSPPPGPGSAGPPGSAFGPGPETAPAASGPGSATAPAAPVAPHPESHAG
jgi:transcriptional regulator with XRE-family HTH domain